MNAVWARTRAEVRSGWRAAGALALLVGLVGGVAIFGAAGYRRTSSALDRFLAFSRPADVSVAGEDLDEAALAALPQVADLDLDAYYLMAPSGPAGEPYLGLGVNPLSSARGRMLRSMDRPILLAGRLPDPAEAAEVVVNEELARARGLSPGDSLVMWGYAPDQLPQLVEGDALGSLPPMGPRLDLRIAGVVRHPYDVTSTARDEEVVYLAQQHLYLTPAFHQRYVEDIANFNQMAGDAFKVRLVRGEDDVAAFSDAVRALPGGSSAAVDTNRDGNGALAAGQRAIDVQALALLAFAALVAVTGMAVVGQSLARQVQLAAVDHPVLRAMGMTPRQLTTALVVQALLLGLVGAALAVAVAVALSPLAPVGVGRKAEVDPGVALDLPVLSLGALAVVAAVLVRTVPTAWRASRPSPEAAQGAAGASPRRPSHLLAAAGAPASSVSGVRMALEPGRGRSAVPVRTALAGTAVAVVAGAVALTFGASLDRLVTTPSLQGWGWDVAVGDENFDNLDKGKQLLPANPVVAGFTAVSRSEVLRVGAADVGVNGLLALEGDTGPEILDGRLPRQPDEIALGPETIEQLDVQVGDRLDVTAPDSERATSMEVVGAAMLGSPALSFEVGLGHGAVVTFEAMEALFGEVQAAVFLVDYAEGVDPTEAFAALQADWGKTVLRPLPPNQVENLRRVGALPEVLAALLAVLAVATLGHTLVTAVHRRRTDLATLKAVGFVPRQVAATVAWLATSLALVALLVGLPLGVAAGRLAWRTVAAGVGTPAGPVTPIGALLVAVPVALLVANAMAALPARRAARIRPAAVLRAE